MNLGIKLAVTPFVFLNPADIDISNKLLHSLEEITLNFKDFGMLTPAYKDRSIHSNFYVWKDKGLKQIINTQRKDYVLKEIYELNWEQFLKFRRMKPPENKWNIRITKKLKEEAKRIF